jgi:hypothetical protein
MIISLLFSCLTTVLAINNENLCTNVDYSERLGKIRDQGYLGTCYAQSAADLVTYETGKRISAGHIAMMSGSADDLVKTITDYDLSRTKFGCKPSRDPKNSATMIEGAAFVGQAIDEVNKSGFCTEESIPSDENFLLFVTSTIDSFYSSPICNSYFIPYIYKFLKFSKDISSPQGALKKLASVCKNKIQITKKSNTLYTSMLLPTAAEKQSILNKTNELLNQKKIASIFAAPTENLFENSWWARLKNVRDQCSLYDAIIFGGTHALTLVGRHFDKEKNICEYRIRNSWGTNCEVYKKKYKCKDGYFWMSEKDFSEISRGIEWLE